LADANPKSRRSPRTAAEGAEKSGGIAHQNDTISAA
jgi:hypothetical protein